MVTLTIHLPEEEFNRLKAQADFELRSPEELMRRSLELLLHTPPVQSELELSKLRKDVETFREANKNQYEKIKDYLQELQAKEGQIVRLVQERTELTREIEVISSSVTAMRTVESDTAELEQWDPFKPGHEEKGFTLDQFEVLFRILLTKFCTMDRVDPPDFLKANPEATRTFKDWANGFTAWRSF